MRAAERRSFFKRAMLALWGMATLVLVFCVALLGYEFMRGQSGTASVPRDLKPAAAVEVQKSGNLPLKAVTLYYGDQGGRSLAPQTHRLPLGEYTPDNCRAALEELIRGPEGALTPILPASTKVRALYLLEGNELVVDFSRELILERQKSAMAEALMLYGVANSLTQDTLRGAKDEPVKTVRFLVEGSPPEKSFPEYGHLDLSRPVGPDPNWISVKEGA